MHYTGPRQYTTNGVRMSPIERTLCMRNTRCRLARSDTALSDSEAMEIAWKAGVSGVFLQEWRCVEGQCRAIMLAQTKSERNMLTADKWWSALPCVYSCPNRWCDGTVQLWRKLTKITPRIRGSAERKFVRFFVESRCHELSNEHSSVRTWILAFLRTKFSFGTRTHGIVIHVQVHVRLRPFRYLSSDCTVRTRES